MPDCHSPIGDLARDARGLTLDFHLEPVARLLERAVK